jgi:hypothetical protein
MASSSYKNRSIRYTVSAVKGRWSASAVILDDYGHSVKGEPIFLQETFETEKEAEIAVINMAKAQIDREAV